MNSARDDSTLGLVLSGGGAYGAAHVGVLQELEARGIRPGIVAGTSSELPTVAPTCSSRSSGTCAIATFGSIVVNG